VHATQRAISFPEMFQKLAETRLGTHVYGPMMAETMQRLAQMDRETEVALQSQGTVRSRLPTEQAGA
jgi:hypothetical protein